MTPTLFGGPYVRPLGKIRAHARTTVLISGALETNGWMNERMNVFRGQCTCRHGGLGAG